VLNAASAALVLYFRGYGLAAALRDSQRLALVIFLSSAALWAQIDFITLLVHTTTTSTPCQIGTIVSTTFDQFARFSIEQFLVWALNTNNGAKLAAMQLIPQVLVMARFLAGAVFIGFTRPQTDHDICVATTSALPVGILVTALDGIIILLLLIMAYSASGVAKQNRDGRGIGADRAGALMSVVLGLAIWTGVRHTSRGCSKRDDGTDSLTDKRSAASRHRVYRPGDQDSPPCWWLVGRDQYVGSLTLFSLR
jgi:hypothetical protein